MKKQSKSKMEFLRRSCLSKVAYPNTSKLREGAKRLSEHFGDRISVHGYFCNNCGKFHLTTKEFSEYEMRRNDNLVF